MLISKELKNDNDQVLGEAAIHHETETSATNDGCCGSRNVSESPAPEMPEQPNPTGKTAGAAVATSATAMLACAACCAVPLAFPAIAATSAGGLLALFGKGHLLFTALALIVVIVGWVRIRRQYVRCKARVSKTTLAAMAFSSVVTLAALAWPAIEPAFLSLLS